MFGLLAIACLVGVTAAAPSGYGALPIAAVTTHDTVSHPHYNFNYAVNDPHTGDYKSQSESRDGGVVKGTYSLREPDGTLRVVDYTADPVSGFNAVVKRVGAAAHPHTYASAPIVAKEIVAPIAHAPLATNYVGLDYGHANLAHADFGHADLGHADLGHADFGHADLGHTDFGHADIGYAGLGYGAFGHADHSWDHGVGYSGLGAWKH